MCNTAQLHAPSYAPSYLGKIWKYKLPVNTYWQYAYQSPTQNSVINTRNEPGKTRRLEDQIITKLIDFQVPSDRKVWENKKMWIPNGYTLKKEIPGKCFNFRSTKSRAHFKVLQENSSTYQIYDQHAPRDKATSV